MDAVRTTAWPAPPGLSRKIAATTLGVLTGTLTLLTGEALLATYRTYLPPDAAPPVEGSFGDPTDPPLRLTLLGDSTAAGVGARRTAETVGARIATALSRDHHVTLASVAVSGSRAGDLGPQVSRALLGHPDVAIVLVGANDATHGTPLRGLARHLHDAVARLRAAGVAVVVGTCPDMSARNFLWPLREVVAWQGRRVARAQAIATHEADAAVVPLGELVGPLFRADPSTLCPDDFHPSARGYELWTEALLPVVQRAVKVQSRG